MWKKKRESLLCVDVLKFFNGIICTRCMCVSSHIYDFSDIGRGVFGQVWCGEAQCHRKGGLWHSQAEERADGGLQTPSLPATRATWPPRYGPGKTYYGVIHQNISLPL